MHILGLGLRVRPFDASFCCLSSLDSAVEELALVVDSLVLAVVEPLVLESVVVDVAPPNSSTPPPMVPPGKVLVGAVDAVVLVVGSMMTEVTVVPPPPSLVLGSDALELAESPPDCEDESVVAVALVSTVVVVADKELVSVVVAKVVVNGWLVLVVVSTESRLVVALVTNAWVTDEVSKDEFSRIGESSVGVLPVKLTVLYAMEPDGAE